MKKKILAIGLVVCMLVVAIGSATMAYFTDTESATNVFTVGDVDIKIDEEFEQGETLLPSMDVVKEVKIQNIGSNDAYVRVHVAVPAGIITPNFVDDNGNWNLPGAQAYSTVIDGELYYVYVHTYESAVEAGEETDLLLASVSMPEEVDCTTNADESITYTNGVFSFTDKDGLVDVLVYAEAGQSEGDAAFNDMTIREAMDMMFGEVGEYCPWGGVPGVIAWDGSRDYNFAEDTANKVVYISSAAQLAAWGDNAKAYAGWTVEITDDINLAGANWTPINMWNNEGYGWTINGNGNTITGMTVNGYINCGFIATFAAYKSPLTINDLTFDNANVIVSANADVENSGTAAAVVVGAHYNKVVLNNVNVTNSSVVSTAQYGTYLGLLTGFPKHHEAASMEVNGCALTDNVVEGYHSIGTVVGCTKKTDCTDSLSIKDTTITGNTLYYKSSNVGAHYVGAGADGYATVEYIDNGGNIIENNERIRLYASATALQTAINNAANGDVIVLGGDITGDVTVTQKADVNFTIDGNGHTFGGVLLVDGKSGTYTTAGLTIKNMEFKADRISADACIRLGDGTNATRYTCNVTVENCTFDVPGAVGVKSYTGGDKNLTITGCTVSVDCHSLVQAKGIDGILVKDCEVYSKNGLNFNNSDNVTVDGCVVDVKGYAVRFGETKGGTGAAETYTIKSCSLKSANDEGDATIILRGTADNATLTIENTTIVGDPAITNTATDATVIQ